MVRRPRVVALAGFLAAALTACESPLSLNELQALTQAEARWAARGFRDYTFEIRRSCFCGGEVTQWSRVDVVAGNVTRVVFLESGGEASEIQRSYFPTVEAVFAEIRGSMDADWVEDVQVEFDRRLGFPTLFSLDPKAGILDAGSTTYVRNVRPLP